VYTEPTIVGRDRLKPAPTSGSSERKAALLHAFGLIPRVTHGLLPNQHTVEKVVDLLERLCPVAEHFEL
jgi:hypothetical protein